MNERRRPLLLVFAGASIMLSCQAFQEQLPTEPNATPSTTPAVTPLSIPVVLPKASPTPTPAPTPSATPTPAPNPTPTPVPSGGSCNLPASNPASPSCTDESAILYGSVDAALTRTTQTRPDLFDFNDKKCENCYRVKNVSGYVAEVQRQLSADGICSHWDGEEMAVKNTNAFSEQYDILLSSGHMRRGGGSYRGVCRPAWF